MHCLIFVLHQYSTMAEFKESQIFLTKEKQHEKKTSLYREIKWQQSKS